MAGSFGFSYIHRPDLARRQEGRQLALCLLPDQRRIPDDPGRGFRATPGFPGRDAALYGRSGDRDRPDASVLQEQPGADVDRASRGADSRGVLPDGPGSPSTAGRGCLLRDLRDLPQGRARAIRRPDAHSLRRGRAHRTRCPPGRMVHGLPADPALDRNLPDNLDAFVRQQYRWCSGNVGIVFSWRLWSIPMRVPARLAHVSGFFYYAYTALVTFFGPMIPIVMLAFLPGQIRLRNFVVLLPAMLTGFVLYPLWHRSSFGPGIWPLGVARGWAHVFAIWDGAWGKSMSWHPTRTPGSSLRRFRIGITWWSGSAAVVWLALAIWRTAALGSCSSRSCCSLAWSTWPWWAGSFSPEARRHEGEAGDDPGRCARGGCGRRHGQPSPPGRRSPTLRWCTPPWPPNRPPTWASSSLVRHLAMASSRARARWRAGRRPSRVRRRLRPPFDMPFAQTIRSHGVIPFVQIDPTDASIAAIAAGTYDDYLRSYADSVRNFGRAVVIGFGHEMNAPWYSWGYGRDPAATFVAASRHIVRLFRSQGADHSPGCGRSRQIRLPPGRRAWWPGPTRHLDRHRRLLLPPLRHLRQCLRQDHRSTARLYQQTGAAVRDRGRARGGPVRQDPGPVPRYGQIQDAGAGLVGQAQHGSLYHQDWRIEDNVQAEISFRLGVRDELTPGGPAG